MFQYLWRTNHKNRRLLKILTERRAFENATRCERRKERSANNLSKNNFNKKYNYILAISTEINRPMLTSLQISVIQSGWDLLQFLRSIPQLASQFFQNTQMNLKIDRDILDRISFTLKIDKKDVKWYLETFLKKLVIVRLDWVLIIRKQTLWDNYLRIDKFNIGSRERGGGGVKIQKNLT